MCGIAGIVRVHEASAGPPPPVGESIPEVWLDLLDDGITHRGPDGQGRFRDRVVRADGTTVDVALVHRRLSIIDHAGGRQPMVHDGAQLRPDLCYARGENPRIASELAPGSPMVAVVFNGCIYNHRALRSELEQEGCRFETDHSDTEVLVHGWRAHGWDLIPKLEAMFAFAIWDRSRGSLFIASDTPGEKHTRQIVVEDLGISAFSSESAGLMRLRVLLDRDNPTGLAEPMASTSWLQFGWGEPLTQSLLAVGVGWDGPVQCHPTLLPKFKRDKHLCADDVEALLDESVGQRLESDVPLCCFLSGGVDSSLIAALAKRRLGSLTTLCVRMPDAAYDESAHARRVAKHLGTDHVEIEASLAPAEDLVELIQTMGEPFGDSSLLPTYWVARAAREIAPVALTGDGGDELFMGYDRQAAALRLSGWTGRVAGLVPGSFARLMPQRDPRSRSTKLARVVRDFKGGRYDQLLAIFPDADLRQLGVEPDRRTGRIKDPQRYDYEHYLHDDLLVKADLASMMVALETRAPFLSRELIERCLSAPADDLMPNGQRKGLLRAVARNFLPAEIVDRPKQGFAIPIGNWFRTDFGSMRRLLRDHLESSDPFPGLAQTGIEIQMAFVHRMLKEHDAAGEASINPWHGRDHSQRLYLLLVLSIWCKWLADIDGDRTRKPLGAEAPSG